MDSSRPVDTRPPQRTAPPALPLPPLKAASGAMPWSARPALVDVSNRASTTTHSSGAAMTKPPAALHEHSATAHPPSAPAPLPRSQSSAAPPSRVPSRMASRSPRLDAMPPPIAMPLRVGGAAVPIAAPLSAASAPDVSMSTDLSHDTQRQDDVSVDRTTLSTSSSSLNLDDSTALAEIELDLDPQAIVTLTLEEELIEQRRVLEISERYELSVVVPQALAAQAERQQLVRSGQLDARAAAHDDAMMRLGLDAEEARDLSMVAEYAQDIFEYMGLCERESMANPSYMDFQDEIQWHMRATLIDWLLQVHMRYHMLPETLWIAVNLVDRFLSARIVSLAKLQLVGVTAMFIAAKYEEILAPSVEEFVFMTDGGYSREEILKGERIVLSTLDFNVSSYCSPYSWVRRISKADDYDIQTRTLCKCLMEVMLLHHLFLRIRPSMIAAIGMFVAKRMLGGVWDDAFVYYSHFTERQLLPGANVLLERLTEPGFEEQFVYKKYASKKFLKASMYARNWALRHRTLHPYQAPPSMAS